MVTSFYTANELETLGFLHYGKNVKISRYARFYAPSNISIGDNVRIDDYCILSGKITIGSNIHISAYCVLYGGSFGITMEDFTGLSARTTIYSAMDDFSGEFLVGPIHPKEKTNVVGGEVIIKKYAHIGAHCILFPNIIVGEGTVVGAMSFVKNSLDEWMIYGGMPVRPIKQRLNIICNIEY